MLIESIVLEGEFVRLEPMAEHHRMDLLEIGVEPVLWEWTANVVRGVEDLNRYIDAALGGAADGIFLPFVTILKADEKVVGSTRFGNIDIPNRKVEIGWTWVASPWQRSCVNTEAKLLMLAHAFEVWNCIRVELKTDAKNKKSRAAMRRIGCLEEGTLRNHMITESGRFRDTVYFSMIESEWPARRSNLQAKLHDNR